MEPNTTVTNPVKKNSYYENFNLYYSNRVTALTNAADANIVGLLTAAGYPPAIIASKTAELEALKKLDDKQKKEYGEQYQAIKEFDTLADSLHPSYLSHVKWGKLIFEDDKAALNALGLNGRRLLAESSYCNQALLFYEGVLNNASYKASVIARGITEAVLQTGQLGFTNLKKMIPVKAIELGEAQQATQKRDEAWEAFENWFVKFKKFAILALSSEPQLREKMGWKE
ncbi:MAG: hypothetical protein QM541_13360 [Flavobacterium sp.]|nr:hypothetical protein [Flavobacterium sp.]